MHNKTDKLLEDTKAIQGKQIKACKDNIAANKVKIAEFEAKNYILKKASFLSYPTEYYTNIDKINELNTSVIADYEKLILLLEIQNGLLTDLLNDSNLDNNNLNTNSM
ncbi:MAG: hypothetical protein WC627_11125 [Legionella sp.]|jgi:hypothetical protein